VLADNKLALNACWDEELLALELQELSSLDAGFDIDLTGFNIAEVDGLIEGLAAEEPVAPRDEALPTLVDGPGVSRVGGVGLLCRHRLVCDDFLSPKVASTLMAGEQVRMVFIDPPCNVGIDGHVLGLGKVKHREFAMASGEMSQEQFTGFLATAFRNLADNSIDGPISFICVDWRHRGEMLEAGRKVFSELKNLIVWDRAQAAWAHSTAPAMS
jgi:hypothetical protein